jgi:RHS repeat-associated protein
VTSAGTKTKYRYDGAGQRIAKKVGSSNAEYYILDGPTTLGVVTLNGSGTPVSWHFNILAGGAPVGRHTNTAARFYYHTDMLGSTRTVVTAAGANAEGYTYYPYGLLNEGLSANFGATKEGFTGKERDAETSLSYFGARYYMPALGRWGAVDPLADEFAGWSGYNYVMGNPSGLVDPDGRVPVPLVALGYLAWQAYEAASTAADVANAATTVANRNASGTDKFVAVVVASVGLGLPGGKAASEAVERVTRAVTDKLGHLRRGRRSEARVLDDLGEVKNTQVLSTSEGSTIPDFQNSRQVGEIKDAQRVSNTGQIRAQREAARESGREHVIVTGAGTNVSGPAQSGSTVVRRDDLGPRRRAPDEPPEARR